MHFELRGKVTIGLFYFDDGVVIIDSGIDENEIRKALNYINEGKHKILGLLLTHYHADHSGGSFFAKKRGIAIYGNDETKFLVENPEHCHVYFTGFYSTFFIKNKFITPAKTEVEDIAKFNFPPDTGVIELPGHTLQHIGFRFGDVIFAGDALFSEENLEKHPIPYFVDYINFRNSLNKLLELANSGMKIICSHGGILDNPGKTVKKNLERLDELVEMIDEMSEKGKDLNSIIKELLLHFNVKRDVISHHLDTAPIKSIIFQNYDNIYENGEIYPVKK